MTSFHLQVVLYGPLPSGQKISFTCSGYESLSRCACTCSTCKQSPKDFTLSDPIWRVDHSTRKNILIHIMLNTILHRFFLFQKSFNLLITSCSRFLDIKHTNMILMCDCVHCANYDNTLSEYTWHKNYMLLKSGKKGNSFRFFFHF